MDSREQRLDEIFNGAIEQPTPEARAQYLSAACGDDEKLRLRIEELVCAYERMGPFLERGADSLADQVSRALSATEATPPPEASPLEEVGDVIGRYKLLQLLGQGGFGSVYMAEQLEPVRRRVALKVIKSGMDTRSVIARFEAERQALAMMEHPHIARALDAGATEQGRPYFVMELVRGIPITHYCDEAKLSLQERLDLFVQVCDAVQHAHTKGIIHRDLKPGNVLVTLHDGKPVPKVIDFGIAKAIDQRLTEKTLFTEFQQMIGTPEYMAPEQAEMSGLDVDTRADIYSLGVLLYELLTGTKPFEIRTLLEKGFGEVIRTIREVDPPKPSTRVSTLGGELRGIADHRRTAPQALGQRIRGDLDSIAMKSLEKDRVRRYQTANEFALDIGRFLHDEPVLATPPSLLYRARKYTRRNKVGVIAAGLVVVAMSVGATMAAVGFINARSEADRANTVQRLVLDLLAAPNPDEFKGPAYSVRELIDDFERRMQDQLSTEPTVEASVRTTLGATLINLGFLERANAQMDRALAAGQASWSGDHEVLADTLRYKGVVLRELGETDSAVAHQQDGIAMRRRLHGDAHREVARDLVLLANTLWSASRLQEAKSCLAEARSIQTRLFGERHEDIAKTISWLGYVHEQEGDLDAALRCYQEARAMYKTVFREAASGAQAADAEDPRSAHVLGLLSRVHRERGDFETAERLGRESLQQLRVSVGEKAPQTVIAVRELATTLESRGQYAEAQEHAREAVALSRETYGTDSLRTALALSLLGKCMVQHGNAQEALSPLNEADAILTKRAPDSRERAVVWNSLGLVALHLNQVEEANRHIERGLTLQTKNLGEQHPEVAALKASLASVRRHEGRFAEAERLFREAIAVQRAKVGSISPVVVANMSALGQIIRNQGRIPEARDITREALALARQHYPTHTCFAAAAGNLALLVEDPKEELQLSREAVECLSKNHDPSHSALRIFRANFAWNLMDHGHFAEAADQFALVVPMAQVFGQHPQPTLNYQYQAVMAFSNTARWEDLAQAARDLLAYREAHQPADAARIGEANLFLGAALENQNKHVEAEGPLRRALEGASETRWTIHWARSLLGGSLAGQGQYEAAEPLLLESYEKLFPPPVVPHCKRNAGERIVALYEAWGRDKDAELWRQKLQPKSD